MEDMKERDMQDLQVEGLSKKEAKEFKELLTKFIKSYGQKPEGITEQEWLKKTFLEELPDITDEQAENLAKETVDSIQEYDENLNSLNEATKNGISKEQWFADKIAKASSGLSVVQYGEYLNSIDIALENANAQMMRTVTTKTGEISQCQNLDGYIAEQYLVNTFNSNAALAESNFFAEVKVPEAGETYGKNSFDVVIRDATKAKATPVHQYQVKYGADAKATIKMLRESGSVTKYSNQQIVVPPEQVAEVQAAFPGKTIVAQIGGTEKVSVTSNELSKAQAKELQLKTQEHGQVPTREWNSFQTKELAMNIGKNAGLAGLQAMAITSGFALAEQVLRGEKIDVEETVNLAVETGADTGLKAATAGAVKVGVEKGIISIIPKGTPAGAITNIVCVSIENVKILNKIAKGELTMTQALDQMGKTTMTMIYGLGWSKTGMVIGASLLSWIPVVGPVVGGFVGGMLGYMGGSKLGQGIYKGLKTVGKGIMTIRRTVWGGIKSIGNKIRSRTKTVIS